MKIKSLSDIIRHIRAGKVIAWTNRNFTVTKEEGGFFIYEIQTGAKLMITDQTNFDLFFIVPMRMSENEAVTIQNFGEQSPYFHRQDMKNWRRLWEVESFNK